MCACVYITVPCGWMYKVGIGMRTVSKPSEFTSGTNASVMDCVVFGLMMRIDLWKRELMAVILADSFFLNKSCG